MKWGSWNETRQMYIELMMCVDALTRLTMLWKRAAMRIGTA